MKSIQLVQLKTKLESIPFAYFIHGAIYNNENVESVTFRLEFFRCFAAHRLELRNFERQFEITMGVNSLYLHFSIIVDKMKIIVRLHS